VRLDFNCNHLIADIDLMCHVFSMVSATYRLSPKLKAQLDKFCETHGLTQQAVVAEALAAWLEDAQDIALVESRRAGPWVDWDDVKDTL
jgi:predicted transcriptional regulator